MLEAIEDKIEGEGGGGGGGGRRWSGGVGGGWGGGLLGLAGEGDCGGSMGVEAGGFGEGEGQGKQEAEGRGHDRGFLAGAVWCCCKHRRCGSPREGGDDFRGWGCSDVGRFAYAPGMQNRTYRTFALGCVGLAVLVLWQGVRAGVAQVQAPVETQAHGRAGAAAAPGAGRSFDRSADAALLAMRRRADELKVSGVAVVAYFDGERVQSWTSKMAVVGRMKDEPSATDKGSNLVAIAYSKAAEMADTLKDSGSHVRPPMTGEVGWSGGVIARGRAGYLIAAFSGGKSEDDVLVSRAGVAEMQAGDR